MLICLSSVFICSCQEKVPTWDPGRLDQVGRHADEIGTFGLIIQTDGLINYSYGDIDSVSRVHSVRKAILSALVFQNLGKVDTSSTLKELEIQDNPISLTELQLTTKVIHLLRSTSGINHPTSSQVGSMQADRDELLGAEPNIPGTKWAYNNWDYNVLTTILEQETGSSTATLFATGIANPLQMEGYETIEKGDTTLSRHMKAGFRLSTRDMAKFGQLFLNGGQWEGQQLIPTELVTKITSDFTQTSGQSNERFGHGYLWWIPDKDYAEGLLPTGSYVSTGAWGQRILVVPAWNTVIAHKTMTEVPTKERKKVTTKEFEKLVILIARARN